MPENHFSYGVVEGFYGKPWSWEDREQCIRFMKDYGYDFYIYAPKNDHFLREKWQDEWPNEVYQKLDDFSESCKAKGIRFGIGLSPFEILGDLDNKLKEDLQNKLDAINGLNPDILCILFDDMKGDVSDLAKKQVKIFDFSATLSNALSFIICPSYYTIDPILEKLFGKMPENYLHDLGKMMDPAVDIFWTGIQVCSPGYTKSHLNEIADVLRRKPFIWDNYPVNDSPSLSSFLRLRAYINRPYQMSEWTNGHAINPMNQAWLSQIPMRTLSQSYALKETYSPQISFIESARILCGQELGNALIEDIVFFQDKGLKNMTEDEKKSLLDKYQTFQSPYAKEVQGWLRGDYQG